MPLSAVTTMIVLSNSRVPQQVEHFLQVLIEILQFVGIIQQIGADDFIILPEREYPVDVAQFLPPC